MIEFFRGFWYEIKLTMYAKFTGYYKTPEKIPIWNMFQVMRGEYKYLYKKPLENVPSFFASVWLEIYYSLEHLELTVLRKLHKIAYLESNYAITQNVRFLNQANTLSSSIGNIKSSDSSLNYMVNYVEETFQSIGAIDVHVMSASRFLSLYNRAIEKNGNT